MSRTPTTIPLKSRIMLAEEEEQLLVNDEPVTFAHILRKRHTRKAVVYLKYVRLYTLLILGLN